MGMPTSFACLAVLALLAVRCSANRKLLQHTSIDCTLLHPQCVSCIPEATWTSTEVVCTRCTSPQYMVSNGSCACSPGYFQATTLEQFCESCGRGSFCDGGTGAAVRQSCGDLLTTDSSTAADVSACITLPGVAYMQGPGTAVKCPAGSYNMGGNRRNCTDCPYGLTTAGTGATHMEVCSAPPGFFYRNRQALPCAVGSYKTGINKEPSCQACPLGLTTEDIAATSAADCSLALPGYQPVLDTASKQIIAAEPCPIGTYSPLGDKCTACPDGLTTQYSMQTDVSACLAQPGYGYYPHKTAATALNASNTTSAAAQAAGNRSAVVACPSGSYKSGWDLEPCVSCGSGYLTEPSPATSSDHCYLPPGYGSKRTWVTNNDSGSAGPLSAALKCVNGTYGSETKQFGLEATPCQPCPENTITPDMDPSTTPQAINTMLMTSVANCSNIPGYGWQHGLAVRCPTGSYNPGFDLRPCLECGTGLNTNHTGATSSSDCQALPGWAVTESGSAEPCPAGTWSAGGSAACQLCPQGSTTAAPAATDVTGCSVCAPGWGGVPALETTQGRVMCAPCVYGSYSPGGTSLPCITCELGFTSPARSTDSTSCYPQWSTQNPHTWIPTPTAAMVPASAVAAAFAEAAAPKGAVSSYMLQASEAPNMLTQIPENAESCQAACGADSGCQYYVFMTNQQDTSEDGCWYKLQTSSPAPNTYLSFRLGTGDYTIYPADQGYDARIGNSVPWTSNNPTLSPTTPSSCLNACDQLTACLATWVSYNSTTSSWDCRLLSGEFRNSVSSSIQAVPQHINDNRWAKDCFGSWSDFGSCNQTCGGGMQFAKYTVVQSAREDGTQCDFADGATKNQTCNTQLCPVDCLGSFGDWSPCSTDCGGGSQSAIYKITTPAANGGNECDVADGAVTNRTCNTQPCSVDCEGEWVWEPCSVECGGGKQTATYNIATPAANGGLECDASEGATRTRKCNTFPCPVDCVGYWSDFSPCSASCGGGIQSSTYLIIQKAAFGGSKCVTHDGAVNRRSCNIQPCPPTDCVGHWEAGPCSQSCGGGVQLASYIIDSPAAYAGKQCEAADGEMRNRSCNAQPCPPVDCVGHWESGPCSQPCGGGVQTVRFVIDQPAVYAGMDCQSRGAELNQSCNTQACPGPVMSSVVSSNVTKMASAAAATQQSSNATRKPAALVFDSIQHINITAPQPTVVLQQAASQPTIIPSAASNGTRPTATPSAAVQPPTLPYSSIVRSDPSLNVTSHQSDNGTGMPSRSAAASQGPAAPIRPTVPAYNSILRINITNMPGSSSADRPQLVPATLTYNSSEAVNITTIPHSSPAASREPAVPVRPTVPAYNSIQRISITNMPGSSSAQQPAVRIPSNTTDSRAQQMQQPVEHVQPTAPRYSRVEHINITQLNADSTQPPTPVSSPDRLHLSSNNSGQPIGLSATTSHTAPVYEAVEHINITQLGAVPSKPAASSSSLAKIQSPTGQFNSSVHHSILPGTTLPAPRAPAYDAVQHINITALKTDTPLASAPPTAASSYNTSHTVGDVSAASSISNTSVSKDGVRVIKSSSVPLYGTVLRINITEQPGSAARSVALSPTMTPAAAAAGTIFNTTIPLPADLPTAIKHQQVPSTSNAQLINLTVSTAAAVVDNDSSTNSSAVFQAANTAGPAATATKLAAHAAPLPTVSPATGVPQDARNGSNQPVNSITTGDPAGASANNSEPPGFSGNSEFSSPHVNLIGLAADDPNAAFAGDLPADNAQPPAGNNSESPGPSPASHQAAHNTVASGSGAASNDSTGTDRQQVGLVDRADAEGNTAPNQPVIDSVSEPHVNAIGLVDVNGSQLQPAAESELPAGLGETPNAVSALPATDNGSSSLSGQPADPSVNQIGLVDTEHSSQSYAEPLQPTNGTDAAATSNAATNIGTSQQPDSPHYNSIGLLQLDSRATDAINGSVHPADQATTVDQLNTAGPANSAHGSNVTMCGNAVNGSSLSGGQAPTAGQQNTTRPANKTIEVDTILGGTTVNVSSLPNDQATTVNGSSLSGDRVPKSGQVGTTQLFNSTNSSNVTSGGTAVTDHDMPVDQATLVGQLSTNQPNSAVNSGNPVTLNRTVLKPSTPSAIDVNITQLSHSTNITNTTAGGAAVNSSGPAAAAELNISRLYNSTNSTITTLSNAAVGSPAATADPAPAAQTHSNVPDTANVTKSSAAVPGDIITNVTITNLLLPAVKSGTPDTTISVPQAPVPQPSSLNASKLVNSTTINITSVPAASTQLNVGLASLGKVINSSSGPSVKPNSTVSNSTPVPTANVQSIQANASRVVNTSSSNHAALVPSTAPLGGSSSSSTTPGSWLQQLEQHLGPLGSMLQQLLNRTASSVSPSASTAAAQAASSPGKPAGGSSSTTTTSSSKPSGDRDPKPQPGKSATAPGRLEATVRAEVAGDTPQQIKAANISSSTGPRVIVPKPQGSSIGRFSIAEAAVVDCQGSWGSWSACSESCGGTQTTWFAVTAPAANGGRPCEAVDGAAKNQTCNTLACVDSYDQLSCLARDQMMGLAPGTTMQCSSNGTLESHSGPFMIANYQATHCTGTSQLMLALPCTEAGQWRLAYSNNVGSYVWVTVADSLAAAAASAGVKCSDRANCLLAATTVSKAMVDANIKCGAGQYVVLHEEEATLCLGLATFTPAAQAAKAASKGWGDWHMNCHGNWSDWSSCSKSCGGGIRTSVYSIDTPPAPGGKLCPVANGTVSTQACNRQQCSGS